MTILGLVGAGGFAREVLPLLEMSLRRAKLANDTKIYIVEEQPDEKSFFGFPLISLSDFCALDCDGKYFNIAFADGLGRQKIAAKLNQYGVKPLSIIHDNVVIMHDNVIGGGAIFCPFSTVTSSAKIGKFFHSNIYSYVAHNCVIGDFVTFAPRVCCNGNVHIDDYAYIGTAAVLKQGSKGKPLKIGRGAIIGMGAVVTKDVAPGAVVVGNPARPLEKNNHIF